MEEIWKDVVGFEGYKVSNFGNVKGKYGRILKPAKDKKTGYYLVCLHKDKKPHTKTVHRLVAKAFIENPNEYPQVNHRDCVKTNNHVDNLEWCTREENEQHKYLMLAHENL